MSNVDDFLRYRAEARVLFPMLAQWALVSQDGTEPEWRHFNSAGIPQYNIPLGYDVNVNQADHLVAYHEAGHEEEERRSIQDPTKAHRQQFLTFIGEPLSWDVLKAIADAQPTPNQQHDADPGEWWADAFANAVAGRIVADKDRTKDALATRAFFLGLTASTNVEVATVKSSLRMIAGHGGKDPGAVAGDLKERDVNIAAVLSFNDVVQREFKPTGVTIVAIGPDDPRDGTQTLDDKIAEANAAGADQVLIEVHHNVGAAGTGAQLWYSQNAKATPGDETWLVLPHLARELGFLIGEPIPQISSDRSRFGKLGILDDTTCTAILVEARNLAMIDRPDWAYSVGIALARAMSAYFGWPRTEIVVPPPPATDTTDKLARAKQIAARASAEIGAL